eukprot:1579991-Amphidinium_carterae.1
MEGGPDGILMELGQVAASELRAWSLLWRPTQRRREIQEVPLCPPQDNQLGTLWEVHQTWERFGGRPIADQRAPLCGTAKAYRSPPHDLQIMGCLAEAPDFGLAPSMHPEGRNPCWEPQTAQG